MATIPNFEAILLEAHQSLGLQTTVKKGKLIGLQKPLNEHLKTVSELLGDVLEALGLVDNERIFEDAMHCLQEFIDFNSHIEQSCWTFSAEMRHIVWFMAGYVYAPGFGRRLAFWNLPNALTPDMPGGAFWFLPKLIENEGKPYMQMPVAQVVDWLLDLLNSPMDQIKDTLGGGQDHNSRAKTAKVETESIERVLYNWRNGELPRIDSIEKYFAEGSNLNFQGVLVNSFDPATLPNLDEALNFIQRKALNANELRLEIPLTSDAIELVLSGRADADMQQHFCYLLARRYAAPSLQTIRQRLLIARACQDAYQRLCKFLAGPTVDIFCADPRQNKALQIIWLFQRSYNLTIDAWKNCNNEEAEDNYFENQIPPWDRLGLFLSVTPSKKFTRWQELGPMLTERFRELSVDSELEDHFSLDVETAKEIALRNISRLENAQKKHIDVLRAIKRCQGSTPYQTLNAITSFDVVIAIAHSDDLPLRKRRMALERAQQLASSATEQIQIILLQLRELLDQHDRKSRPVGAMQTVTNLLAEAKNNAAFPYLRASILQFEAKHLLARNAFELAHKAFDAALDAAIETSCGRLRGDIARDAFAVAVSQQSNGYHLPNQEKYMRHMLFNGAITNPIATFAPPPALEDIACEVDHYFWDCLYWPYAGYPYEEPPSLKILQEVHLAAFKLMLSEEWSQLETWLQQNKQFATKRQKDVRGDTMLMLWLKLVYNHDELCTKLPQILPQILPQNLHSRLDKVIELTHSMRTAIALIIAAWPKSASVTDFKLQSPLMLAATHGDLFVVQKLLGVKANAKQQDYEGRTALNTAIAARSVECVQALLAFEPELTKLTCLGGQTVLHTAVRVGHPTIVQSIFECSPDLVLAENEDGCTPLELAQLMRDDPEAFSAMKLHLTRERRQMGTIEDYQEICRILAPS